MDFKEFDKTLDAWTEEEHNAAERAKAAGDERGHSIALMKKSMYSTMLRQLGHNAPHALEGCKKDLLARKEKKAELGDADSVDRISIQIECITRVQQLIEEIGGSR